MRRLLIIVMMVVLPLQFGWAAAATYCQHESSPITYHFGHHVHTHAGKADNSKSQQKANSKSHQTAGSKLVPDDDCAVCHLGSVGMVSMPLITFSLQVANIDKVFVSTFLLASDRPDRPERPKWVHAAL